MMISSLSFLSSKIAGVEERPKRHLPVPGVTGERAVGQERQTVFVVVFLAVFMKLREGEIRPPARGARATSAAM
tara:strand:- start:208 stop:429 length:222 start_codon:yes stop_codon:yes gene_type:complete